MRKSFLSASMGILSMLVFGCDSISGTGADLKIKLKEDGKINCEIVVPEEAGPVAEFAGKELQDVVSQSLGGKVELLKSPGGQKTAIILGNSKQLKEAGVDISKLSRDGFVIKSYKGNILIAGRDSMKDNPEKAMNGGCWGLYFERGTLFGVYEFLERFADVRFYFPGDIGTVIPKHEKLALPECDILEKPDYTVRKFSWLGATSGTVGWMPKVAGSDFKWKNQMYYRWRMETEYLPCCHGLSRLTFLERFSETHPEYFALTQDGRRYKEKDMAHTGQLCLSSGIRAEIYKDAEAFLTGKDASTRNMKHSKYGNRCFWDPSGFQPGYFDIMPQDSFYPCRCEKCQAHYSKGDQATSDYVWGMVVEVAEKLKKNGIPGCVNMMAYTPYRPVPTQEIPDNVRVMVAVGGPWYMDKGDAFKRETAIIDAWRDKLKGKKPWLWNYTCKFAKLAIPDIPASTPMIIGEYYKAMSSHIFGAYMESNALNEEVAHNLFIQNYLNHYVFAKVAWKNSTDVNALLKEHYQKMFGSAAPQMEEAFKMFEKKWLEIVGKPIDTPLGPQSITLSDYDIWEKVYSPGELEKLKALFDKSEELTAKDADSLKRVKFIREKFLAPVIAQRAQYAKNQEAINDLRFYVKEIPSGEKINLDGKLDDPAWKSAAEISLVPHASEKSKKETGIKTKVKALRNGENIYFAFDCEEPEMDKLLSSKREKDDKEIWKDSSVEIFLNPSNDRNIYYQMMINADGSISDLSASKKGGKYSMDWKWNSGAEIAASKGAKGWTVELAVPVKNIPGLKYDRDFPANFNRNRCLSKETNDFAILFTWSPFLKNGFHDIDNFGYITFSEPKSSNIIKNSSFNGEVKNNLLGGKSGWILPGKMKDTEAFSIVDDPFSESGKALLMERKSSENGSFTATQYLPDLKADTEYLLSYAVKVEDLKLGGNRASGAVVNIWDDKNVWFPKNYFVSNMPWSRQGFKFKTGPNTNKPPHKSYITLRIMSASCKAYFSDVKLIPVE
ncbi:MAG: hypothetical protein A2017_07945 [Lentisphaerae bacterium GWF2_44_16]|nr:MAG: hypothetical protein A2017_07945 [Lentisphaerae bacterium GWF2_44_16]